MNADELEAAAKEARRRADVAKHKPMPLEELDYYGETELRVACHKQIDLINLATDLQNAYCDTLQHLKNSIRLLRAEALYWRQMYDDEINKGTSPT